jgi:tetratricopeptide (TPR) repeat protein
MNPRTSLAAATGLFILASASFAQLTGLEGDVKGVDGKLVPNATVRIARLDAKRTYPAKADKKGHYFYNGLPAGLYSITVQIDGQDAGGVSGVFTRPGAPLVVDIFLADKPEQQAQRTRQQVRQVGAEWSYVKPLVIQGTASAPALEAQRPAESAEPDRKLNAGEKAAREQEIARRAEALKQRQGLNDAFNAGVTALEEKRYPEAIASLQKALEADPRQAIVWANLAAAYVRLAGTQASADSTASIQQGLDAYAKAIELKPDEAVFHNNYALALARAGRLPEMQAEMKKSAALEPANAYHSYYNMGAALTNGGQQDAAADAFRLAIAAAPDEPNNAEAYYQYGLALMSKAQIAADGKVVPAPGTAEAFRKYLVLAPTGPNSRAAADMLATLGSSMETGFGAAKTVKKK